MRSRPALAQCLNRATNGLRKSAHRIFSRRLCFFNPCFRKSYVPASFVYAAEWIFPPALSQGRGARDGDGECGCCRQLGKAN